MTTATARWGFPQINPVSGGDNVDVVTDFNTPWALIDTLLGQVCTSTTRPAVPVAGQTVSESNTGFVRKYTGTAWQTVGNAVATSGARPANPIAGDELYETDNGAQRNYTGAAWGGILPAKLSSGLPANPIQGDVAYLTDLKVLISYTGTAWVLENSVTCTSTTRPTVGLQAGQFIYETDTSRILAYTGSTWVTKTFVNFVCTSSTHPSWAGVGLEIYETDTGLNALYNGTNYLYGFQQIAPTQILGSSAGSVTFNSIPAVGKIALKWRAKGTSTTGDVEMQIDGVTTSSYQSAKIQGRAAAATVATTATTYAPIGVLASSTTANYFSSGSVEINGWSNASTFLTYSGQAATFDTASSYWTEVYNGQYLAVGPHTSLKITPQNGSFAAGSEFSLYACP